LLIFQQNQIFIQKTSADVFAQSDDRGYGHWRLREHSLSPSDKVNAGAKLPECTSASQ
jgi:hypothetical protein